MKSFRRWCKEDVTIEDAEGKLYAEVIDIVKAPSLEPPPQTIPWEDPLKEATFVPKKIGKIIDVYVGWRGKGHMIKMFFPQVTKPSRKSVQDQVEKVYPGGKVWSYQVSEYEPGNPLLYTTD